MSLERSVKEENWISVPIALSPVGLKTHRFNLTSSYPRNYLPYLLYCTYRAVPKPITSIPSRSSKSPSARTTWRPGALCFGPRLHPNSHLITSNPLRRTVALYRSNPCTAHQNHLQDRICVRRTQATPHSGGTTSARHPSAIPPLQVPGIHPIPIPSILQAHTALYLAGLILGPWSGVVLLLRVCVALHQETRPKENLLGGLSKCLKSASNQSLPILFYLLCPLPT